MWIHAFLLLLNLQSGPLDLDSLGPEVLSSSERARIARENKLDNRIKVYEKVSIRYLRTLQGQMRTEEQDIESTLEHWLSVLRFSLADIEKHAERKKKSRPLIHYEIQLRKAIVDVRELRLKAVAEDDPLFERWLTGAESIRNRFVDVIFAK
jgi:hypothetical protein